MTPPHEIPLPGPAATFAAELRARLPVLDTPRLRLRVPILGDFAHYLEIVTGPRGIYILATPDRDVAWYDFCQLISTWLLRGHGLWTVEGRADGAVLGFVLLGFEPGDREPELGYMLHEAAEGRGIATEAAQAARAYAWDVADLPSLVSNIDPDNTRSARLAERLDARRDTRAEAAYRDNPVHVYRHPKPEVCQ